MVRRHMNLETIRRIQLDYLINKGYGRGLIEIPNLKKNDFFGHLSKI